MSHDGRGAVWSNCPRTDLARGASGNRGAYSTMDKWFVEDARPRLHGRAFMVRYADDIVCVCENREDADRLFGVLPKRFERFG